MLKLVGSCRERCAIDAVSGGLDVLCFIGDGRGGEAAI
jgi:hypothetical protein